MKRTLEIDTKAAFDSNETGLQPIAVTPEFKAMLETTKDTSASTDEVRPAKLASDLPLFRKWPDIGASFVNITPFVLNVHHR